MKVVKSKKHFVTLVEMMIVMFLIAMITGVIAYNYTGSLDEGKAFKTKAGIEKIHTVLDLHFAMHPEEKENIAMNWKNILKESQLVKNSRDLEKDGWGVEYTVTTKENGEIEITSAKYTDYLNKKGQGSLFKDSNN
ncbi:putative outer membrane protein [Candidatus Protochlamydia amoebophila]|uniref:type II secretion system protein n=1 Tax=Candidatus Protochlamydia amoebophila TaxID=362787 RepID=UPI001BCA0CA3|nr:type II secretion system protein [Candidatus Protochlamydia amoebophila]MBS4164725.1 putative outer membrane protein [Candidatus Protochlamydia amoebophila]